MGAVRSRRARMRTRDVAGIISATVRWCRPRCPRRRRLRRQPVRRPRRRGHHGQRHPGDGRHDRAGAGCTYTFTTADNNWYGPNALPAIASTITIEGNGAIIERNTAAPKFRLFYVGATRRDETLNYTSPGAGNLRLRNLTVRGGLARGGNRGPAGGGGGGAGLGGAVFSQGRLTLERGDAHLQHGPGRLGRGAGTVAAAAAAAAALATMPPAGAAGASAPAPSAGRPGVVDRQEMYLAAPAAAVVGSAPETLVGGPGRRRRRRRRAGHGHRRGARNGFSGSLGAGGNGSGGGG